jgi:ABC-type amino acid transport substrate-binding protein
MPRAYTIATAALALGTSVKWLDNVLSHNRVPGVAQERQGISRRLTIEALLVLALAVLLIQELGLLTGRAIELAEELAKNEGRFIAERGLILGLDLTSFRVRLLESLENAVEIAPVPRRGRPPGNKTGRLD